MMPLTILMTGFMLGFAGSLHCVGMCGPLSLAVPTHHLPASLKFFSLLLYQFGRIVTYSIFGFISGLAGRGIYMAGFQQWFSITLGVIILLSGALYFIQGSSVQLSFLNRGYHSLSRLIGKIIKRNAGLAGFLFLGMANGLLPCGMVYIALAATLSFIKVYQGIAFMAMFGLGTLPAMMLVAYGGRMISPGSRQLFRKSIPFFITAAGILLILRGLNAGILFISPSLPNAPGLPVNCHQ